MDRKSKFFICEKCKNIVESIQFSGNSFRCCNAAMENMEPKIEDAGGEKHLPEVSVRDGCVTVTVGRIPHPMTEEHGISWVYLVTKYGEARKLLLPGEEPKAVFYLENGDIPIAAYAYCNAHGLWKTQINE